MTFGDFDAVAHDVNDFGNVPNQIVIIRSETVAKAVLNPNAKFKADFFPAPVQFFQDRPLKGDSTHFLLFSPYIFYNA